MTKDGISRFKDKHYTIKDENECEFMRMFINE
jgi:hypothetical protein